MTQTPTHQVGLHYDSILNYETIRLTHDSPVEFAVTARTIDRFLPKAGVAADIGVGVGHYSELLARRGFGLHLIDVSQKLLDSTSTRLRAAGLGRNILSRLAASATDLGHISAGSCDAVLMLGPLYHLCSLEERRQALGEAQRILRPGGVIFAAGINRLAYLRDILRRNAGHAANHRAFYQAFLQTGNLDPSVAPGIGYAHLTTVAEFRDLLTAMFAETAMIGLESFTSGLQEPINKCSPAEREAWIDLAEQTAATPEGLAAADHFLFVGRKG